MQIKLASSHSTMLDGPFGLNSTFGYCCSTAGNSFSIFIRCLAQDHGLIAFVLGIEINYEFNTETQKLMYNTDTQYYYCCSLLFK